MHSVMLQEAFMLQRFIYVLKCNLGQLKGHLSQVEIELSHSKAKESKK